jgi:hypothetical protein
MTLMHVHFVVSVENVRLPSTLSKIARIEVLVVHAGLL